MKKGYEYYQVQVTFESDQANIYRTYESNQYKLCLEAFKKMEKSLKGQEQKYLLTFSLISRGVMQVIKIRSSTSEPIDSPLF